MVARVDEELRLRELLEAIIYASDGCRGHAGCNHSMEPWRLARLALAEMSTCTPKDRCGHCPDCCTEEQGYIDHGGEGGEG